MNDKLSLRLFVAFEISEALKAELIEWRRQSGLSANLRWLPEWNFHITLIPPWNEHDLLAAIRHFETTVQSMRPPEFDFKTIEAGPSAIAPRLLWLFGDVAKPGEDVEDILRKYGALKRKFNPHVTIARFNPAKAPAEIVRMRAAFPFREKPPRISLIESRLTPEGAQYTTIRSFSF